MIPTHKLYLSTAYGVLPIMNKDDIDHIETRSSYTIIPKSIVSDFTVNILKSIFMEKQ